jgi:hypothetical protein
VPEYLVSLSRHDGSSANERITDDRDLRRGMKIHVGDEPPFEVTATRTEPDGTRIVLCVPYPKEEFGPPVSARPD